MGVEARLVVGRHRVEALLRVLFLAVELVAGIGRDVVPGVVGEDVVVRFEVALAELEGGAAFAVGEGVVGAVGWQAGRWWFKCRGGCFLLAFRGC